MSRITWVWAGVITALVLSLLANLFFAGLILGHRASPGAAPERLAVLAMLADAPPELRRQLRRSLISERRALGAEMRGISQARSRIAALLESPSPQRDDLEAAFATLQAHHAAGQKLLHRAFTDAILAADLTARQQWAERWRQKHPASGLRLLDPSSSSSTESSEVQRPERTP